MNLWKFLGIVLITTIFTGANNPALAEVVLNVWPDYNGRMCIYVGSWTGKVTVEWGAWRGTASIPYRSGVTGNYLTNIDANANPSQGKYNVTDIHVYGPSYAVLFTGSDCTPFNRSEATTNLTWSRR